MSTLFSTKRSKTLRRIHPRCRPERALHVGKAFNAAWMASLKSSFVDLGQDPMTASEAGLVTLKVLFDLDVTPHISRHSRFFLSFLFHQVRGELPHCMTSGIKILLRQFPRGVSLQQENLVLEAAIPVLPRDDRVGPRSRRPDVSQPPPILPLCLPRNAPSLAWLSPLSRGPRSSPPRATFRANIRAVPWRMEVPICFQAQNPTSYTATPPAFVSL